MADLIGLPAGTSRAIEYAGPDVAARDRILAVILDGLRPPVGTAAALPGNGEASASPAA